MGDRELSPFEDFNFSKAAIKYSGSLTKDQVFTGLRALVQQLGEAASNGQEIDLDFGSIGRLLVRAQEPRFCFSQAMLSGGEDGLGDDGEAGPGGYQRAQRGPPSAAAFRKDASEDALGLGIQGAAPGRQETPPRAMPAITEDMPALQLDQEDGYGRGNGPESRRSDMMSNAGSQLDDSMRRTPMLTSQQFKREVAYKEAMDRHIGEMEARAGEAVAEKDAWHGHVNDCLEQERDEMQPLQLLARLSRVLVLAGVLASVAALQCQEAGHAPAAPGPLLGGLGGGLAALAALAVAVGIHRVVAARDRVVLPATSLEGGVRTVRHVVLGGRCVRNVVSALMPLLHVDNAVGVIVPHDASALKLSGGRAVGALRVAHGHAVAVAVQRDAAATVGKVVVLCADQFRRLIPVLNGLVVLVDAHGARRVPIADTVDALVVGHGVGDGGGVVAHRDRKVASAVKDGVFADDVALLLPVVLLPFPFHAPLARMAQGVHLQPAHAAESDRLAVRADDDAAACGVELDRTDQVGALLNPLPIRILVHSAVRVGSIEPLAITAAHLLPLVLEDANGAEALHAVAPAAGHTVGHDLAGGVDRDALARVREL